MRSSGLKLAIVAGANRRLKTAIWVAAVCYVSGVAGPLGAPQVDTRQVLDQYSRGEFAAAIESAVPLSARWPRTYAREASVWIALAPSEVPRRRLAAAGLLVEVARARYEGDWETWRQWRDTLEWACRELQRTTTPVAGEQAWHRAVAALTQRTYDWAWLERTHLQHSIARFPDDLYLPMAAALARADAADAPADRRIRIRLARAQRDIGTTIPTASRTARVVTDETLAAVGLLRPAMSNAEFGAFVETRVSHLYLMIGEHEAALQHARDAAGRGREPRIRYLGHFLAGQALEGLGRATDAREAYGAALRELPSGQSAALTLVALAPGEYLWVQRLDLPMSGEHDGHDPYRLYPYGTYVYWTDFTAELRRAIHP